MNLINEAINKSLLVWDKCANHPFIVELCDGTLDSEKIKKYMVEDSIYLREYAKCFSYGIINSKTLKDIKMFYSMMSYINENEGSTRLKYLKMFNLNDEMLNDYVPEDGCSDYYNFMIEMSKKDKLSCMMATLPCMLSYKYIFEKMLKENKINKDSKYIDIINDYLSDYYSVVCDKWINYTNDLAKDINNLRKEELVDMFYKSSLYELGFWNMCYNVK